jgi:hypothetical protein
MSEMRMIGRIAGLCLVAMFAVSMVAAATASAAPVWEQCSEGASGTKYETDQCLKTSSTGKWAWEEVKGTEKALGLGTLTLRDTNVPIAGTVEVGCTGESKGSVGPGKFARIEKIENIKCAAGKNCEKIIKIAEPINLPWQTELIEEGGNIRNKITAVNGKGAGWAMTCRVLGIEGADECTSEEGTTLIEDESGSVESIFDSKTAKAKCSVGGAKSGEVLGTVGVAMANGVGLRGDPPWVFVDNVGGVGFVGPVGLGECIFTAEGQICKLNFYNRTVPAKLFTIQSVTIEGTNGVNRYKRVGEGCRTNQSLNNGEFCQEEVKAIKFVANTRNQFCIQVKDPGLGGIRRVCAELVM